MSPYPRAASAVADPGEFQGFHGNPLLKFIYSNRAVDQDSLY